MLTDFAPSLSLVSAVVVTALVLWVPFYLWWSKRSRTSLPPFPRVPLPVLGNLLNLDANPRRTFEKWRQQCGDVYSMYMGQTLVVVVNGHEAIKEALVTHGDNFSDRPNLFMDQAIGNLNSGLVTSSGTVWKEQRLAACGILRQIGSGAIADKIQEEVRHLLQLLKTAKDAPFDLGHTIPCAFSNVICAIILGERCQDDDPNFRFVVDNITWLGTKLKLTNPLHFYPWLMKIPGDPFEGKAIQRRLIEILDLFSNCYIEENEADLSRENFITLYLRQCHQHEEKGTPTTLSKTNLARSMFDMITAGTDTSALTVLWLILHLLHNPKVQEKVQAEIDTQIGAGRLPNPTDRPLMPYLSATIMEAQRIGSVVPLSITHLCSKTETFRGYTIPKGASIAPNLDSILYDEKIWGKGVDVFRPERHLDESGNLVTRSEFIPFSVGRRYCIGDNIAKMELFQFISAMLQKFTFLPEHPNNLPTTEDIYGITRNPHPFKVRIVER